MEAQTCKAAELTGGGLAAMLCLKITTIGAANVQLSIEVGIHVRGGNVVLGETSKARHQQFLPEPKGAIAARERRQGRCRGVAAGWAPYRKVRGCLGGPDALDRATACIGAGLLSDAVVPTESDNRSSAKSVAERDVFHVRLVGVMCVHIGGCAGGFFHFPVGLGASPGCQRTSP